MRHLYFMSVLVLFVSCIPIAVKPNIEDYKITNGKSFKKGLPNQTSFVFEDPKNADEFYTYINVKFNRNHINSESNIPITIDDQIYYMTFFEVERASKTINLLPMAVDALLKVNNLGSGDTFQNTYAKRSGSWYISIVVLDDAMKDVLAEETIVQEKVVSSLRALKQEYLSTANYQEIYFKNPPPQ